ncbi:MAG: hypothetical protein DMG50_11570 [Acidobacteria bacterium]|nr:MAG: hypothetical protein DMG50_11570 [Acidobacteriota bacterium]
MAARVQSEWQPPRFQIEGNFARPTRSMSRRCSNCSVFLGWTQVWGANERIEYARLMANTNPHPLPRFRGNGPLSNMAEFAKAFGCKKGESMVREQACKIW